MQAKDLSEYTILIAEDDPTSLKFFNASLAQSGIQILNAENGREAIEKFNNHKIDVVIMDAMMPVMNGFDATAEIKQKFPSVPVLILTAYVGPDSIRKAVSSGCNDYLAKPIEKEVLIAAVEKWTVGKKK